VAHGGAEPLRSDEFVLAPGERHDAGRLELRAGFPVTGRVVDESGAAIDGARVVVASGGSARVGGAVRAERRRRAVLAGAAGGRLPAVRQRGRASHGPGRVDVTAGSSPPALQIKLMRAEAALEGMVRDDGGRPLARARLSVWPAGAFEAGATPSGTPVGGGVADVGGHFNIASLPAGEVRLEVNHPRLPDQLPRRHDGHVREPDSAVSGRNRRRGQGEDDRRGDRARTPGGDRPRRREGERRRPARRTFRLLRLVPGHWRVNVVATGFHNAERELDVPASSNLGEASIRDLRLELDGS
jgi:hypothetical protein